MEAYGFEVPVMVRLATDFKQIIDCNPYLKVVETEPNKLFITFLGAVPEAEKLEALKAVEYPGEEYVMADDYLYFHPLNGYGRAKMNNSFFERKLKVRATTRNWKSLNKLWEMANES